MSQARLYIAVPLYNRRKVVELCVPTIRAGCAPDDAVILYDDGSTEYDSGFWETMNPHATGVVWCDSMGIDAQRRKHILEFWGNREIHGCTHLALIDSDIICDPSWREVALSLQSEHGGAPICLYRTQVHADYEGNIFKNDPRENVLWQRFAPGVFYLLTLAHCEKLANHMPERMSWDWWAPGVLGYKMAISRVSYVDHVGWRGMHHKVSDGIEGGDRATNPTEWLVKKRAEIVHALSNS